MYGIYFYMFNFLFLKLIIYFLATGCFAVVKTYTDENDLNSVDRPQVEIRAVLIKCGTEDGSSITSDTETARFERDELFKHSALRDCDKKLAVTAKITTEPEITGDEYIPIEHVFEGLVKKRIRLLDPYILRLRRELPLQAYRLKRVDTISGVLTGTKSHAEEQYDRLKVRAKRDVKHVSTDSPWILDQHIIYDQGQKFRKLSNNEETNIDAQSQAFSQNITLNSRKKRNEHNIVVEKTPNEEQQWDKNHLYRLSDGEVKIDEDEHNDKISKQNEVVRHLSTGVRKERKLDGKLHVKEDKGLKGHLTNFRTDNAIKDKNPEIPKPRYKLRTSHGMSNYQTSDFLKFDSTEQKDYDVYEIGIPELWYTVHVQLFNKMSTAEGKTVWNDLTKGERASVGSLNPEWRGQDLNVRYSPAEWIPRKDFTLPTTSLCLLAPKRRETDLPANNISNGDGDFSYEEGGYVIVPKEDVMEKEEEIMLNKRDDNTNNTGGYRRVTVRISRALLGGISDKINIVTQNSDKYLTIPHCRSNLVQLDLEARADENELVRVGSSGCISTAVSDSTRRSRTVLTLQVGNTGLAAASFRVTAQDCGPALSKFIKDKDRAMFTFGPELIPPRHTRSLLLELPFELPTDDVHCSVSLLNDEDTSVAVRDVAIKKGDRCFCVWHCDCVCLGEDPKLMCRSMPEPLQLAAGLSTWNRPRRARCVCCVDIVSVNLFVIFTGVLLALLLLGLVKASVGLICSAVSIWGLDRLMQTPRKLDHYYECSLRSRRVEYDCKGWPIHPDTRKRTVHFVSRQMEFFLNVVFFVCVPCIMIYEAIKTLVAYLLTKASYMKSKNKGIKKTSQDMQDEEPPSPPVQRRRRHGALRRWMTPGAQDLSGALWSKSLAPAKSIMRPLIFANRIHDGMSLDHHDLYADSEQDDTEYVLTQMQKSRESLAVR